MFYNRIEKVIVAKSSGKGKIINNKKKGKFDASGDYKCILQVHVSS